MDSHCCEKRNWETFPVQKSEFAAVNEDQELPPRNPEVTRPKNLLQLLKKSELTKTATVFSMVVGLIVLAGWIFNIGLLKSVIPGAVEMKANTAIGLILAALGLFLIDGMPSSRQQRTAQFIGLLVMLLGLATLGQYVFDWHLGIDEFLFKDTANAFNAIRGRMSPYSAVVLSMLGAVLIVLPLKPLRLVARALAVAVVAIGTLSIIGYIWNASELVTDQWLPPVALNTAIVFLLLGLSTLHASSFLHEHVSLSTSIEVKILFSFITTFCVLILAGAYTYRMGAQFENSGRQVKQMLQVRVALSQYYIALANAESAQRSYLLTSNPRYTRDFTAFLDEHEKKGKRLTQLLPNHQSQSDRLNQLTQMADMRTALLKRNIVIFENHGIQAVRRAIAQDDNLHLMQNILSQIQQMDEIEQALLTDRENTLNQTRRLTFLALLFTLLLAVVVLTIFFLMIRREIIARAHAEQSVQQAKEKAESANIAKDSFLATMSHEIRTPLTGMLGMLELLSLGKLSHEQLQTLNTARNSGKALVRIVNDILDWSKIEDGKLELSPHPTSIPELLRSVVNTYSRVASAKALILSQHSDSRLHEAYIVDPLRLSQILNNFVSNAIKFTQRGEVELHAELLDRAEHRDRIRFAVRDTGPGIPKDKQAYLFMRFQQENAETARLYGGTGLGLAICRRLTEMMEGEISVRSEQGLGSIFSVEFVLQTTDRPALKTHSIQRTETETPPLYHDTATAPLVLAVDDHPTNRDLLARQLIRLGLRVVTAENGLQALSIWCQFSPQWSQFVFGVKEPLNFRRNGARVFSA